MLRVGGLTPLSTPTGPACSPRWCSARAAPGAVAIATTRDLIPARGDGEIPWDEVIASCAAARAARRRGVLRRRADAAGRSGGRDARSARARVQDRPAHRRRRTRAGWPKCCRWSTGWDSTSKAPFADYARITGIEGSGKRAQASLECLLASGVVHQIRTPARASGPAGGCRCRRACARDLGTRREALCHSAVPHPGLRRRSAGAEHRAHVALGQPGLKTWPRCSHTRPDSRCQPRSGPAH